MSDKGVVKVSMRVSYGRELFYPENDTAQLFMRLVAGLNRRARAMVRRDMETVQALGYLVEVVSKPFGELPVPETKAS